MCKIAYGSIPDDGRQYVIECPTDENIQELMDRLGKDVEYYHVHCEEGTLTVGCAEIDRADVFYRRNLYKDLTTPQGWSVGLLVDDEYANSTETLDTISGGMLQTVLLYHTVVKEVAQRMAEHFLEKQAFLEGYTWLRR